MHLPYNLLILPLSCRMTTTTSSRFALPSAIMRSGTTRPPRDCTSRQRPTSSSTQPLKHPTSGNDWQRSILIGVTPSSVMERPPLRSVGTSRCSIPTVLFPTANCISCQRCSRERTRHVQSLPICKQLSPAPLQPQQEEQPLHRCPTLIPLPLPSSSRSINKSSKSTAD